MKDFKKIQNFKNIECLKIMERYFIHETRKIRSICKFKKVKNNDENVTLIATSILQANDWK